MDKAKLDSDGYEVVRGFLDPTICELLAHTVRLMETRIDFKELYAAAPPHKKNGTVTRDQHWDGKLPGEDPQVPKSYAWYGDPLMDSMLSLSGPFIGQLIDKQLFPTYSYCRSYRPGATLPEHDDRAECQYSATVALGGDPWRIYMGETGIDLAHGDMLVYSGCELLHRRDEFKGRECIQLFLHYGDVDNPIGERFDSRLGLGLPRTVDGAVLNDMFHASKNCTETIKTMMYYGKED